MEPISEFKKNGYVLLKDYLKENINLLESITKKFVELPDAKNKYMKYYETIDTKKVLSRMEYLIDFDEQLNKLENDVIKPIASYYLDSDVNLFKEKINFKLPGGGAFKPHQDFPAWNDFSPTEYVTIGIPLDNMTRENGCLNMATTIGRNKQIYHNEENNDIPDNYLNTWKWDELICNIGDVIVFDSFIPHYSKKNNTNKNRRIYYFTYNKSKEGNLRISYYNKKREVFPQDVDKIEGKDYSKLGAKYNLGNPINKL